MMKKWTYSLVASMVFIVLLCAPSIAEGYYYDYFKMVKLVIGEKEAQLNDKSVTMDQAAYVKSGRTLVPFRFLGESLGAKVTWDPAKNQAILDLGERQVKVTIGSKVANVNGELATLDVAAEIKSGRTFIPLRFVSESLGAWVGYEAKTQMVTVRYVDRQNWKVYEVNPETTYKYPSNWKVTKEQNGIPCFTSPNDSKLWVYYLELSVDEAVAQIKSEAPGNGYTLESEEPIWADNPSAGTILTFSKASNNPNDSYMNYIYIYDLGEQNTRVEDELMLNSDAELEWPVMDAIANS